MENSNFPRKYCFDCGDNTVKENLKERLSAMRDDLGDLKRELEIEKKFLQIKKDEIYGNCGYFSKNMNAEDSRILIHPGSSRSQRISEPTRASNQHISLDKGELLKIQGQCDKELENLHSYIHHLGEIRKNWVSYSQRSLNITPNSQQQYRNSREEKQEKRQSGKVFYVDGDLPM
ncbi:uncharacterized protein LOC126740915 [Anthonomus grandis grandis]|uniref:uncharacterized protein LOC126740915 n=1 Tax=Anthonomus grandis grandis TaxID=2921223 RepID=UPI002166A806|nr:uncharacterized protein LOC126740915 [Anthonomus grandis grandis]